MNTGHPLPMSAEELLSTARDMTGIDLVDKEAEEPLARLHDSLCTEAGLSESGALGWQTKLLRLLTNRLYMRRDFAEHPEIADEVVESPLVVFGMPRSGTTKTQKALAASGDFNYLTFWQTWNWASRTGRPNEATQGRIDEADRWCRWFDQRSPETKLGHPYETHEPEEDHGLTEGCLEAPWLIGYAEIPSYVQWAGQQDPHTVFAFLRDSLKYLQWQGLAARGKPWLLKSPMYTAMEPVLLDVFPGARLVMTHRSPLQTLPSTCKLLECFRRPFSEQPPNTGMVVEGFAMAVDAQLGNRQAFPELPLLDVAFDDVSASWPQVAERIYAHVGLALTAVSRERTVEWEARNPAQKYGRFSYSLEEFGLTESQIMTRMSGYVAFLEAQFGRLP